MRRFLREGIEGAEVAPDVDHCPLCRIWSVYNAGLARENEGKAVTTFDREKAHAFLEAGFWAGIHKPTGLCETHAHHQTILDAMNAELDPPKEPPPS